MTTCVHGSGFQTLTLNGKKKGDAVMGDLRGTYKLNSATIDAGLSSGKVCTTTEVRVVFN